MSFKLSRDEVRYVDRFAIKQYGIPPAVLMENAGRGCVDWLRKFGIRGPVVILCGKGNNAGDGLVIARHLLVRGAQPRVLLAADPQQYRGETRMNYEVCRQADVAICDMRTATDEALREALHDADWIVDALLGTGASGAPRSPMDAMIRVANELPARRMAIDIPSGLDCDTGCVADPTFRADHTCTFVAKKVGFDAATAQPFLGEVHVVDIGLPPNVVLAAVADRQNTDSMLNDSE